ncbi:MAG: mucoidy inhibitor MuiA family protein [Blastocatellia bacterium]
MTILETTITNVTVYTSYARVTRQVKTKLTTGDHTLVVNNLPDTFLSDSVRVSGQGSELKIIAVEVNQQMLKESLEVKTAELEKVLKSLQLEEQKLNSEAKIISSKLSLLNQLQTSVGATFPRSISYNKNSIDNLDKTLNYLTQELQNTYKQELEFKENQQGLAKQIAITKYELNKLQNKDVKLCWEIQVFVEMSSEAEIILEISYLVNGASWQPLYDIRLVEDKVTLSYLASITQQTGEEWKEVDLSLSTAQAATTSTIPELSPWYLRVYSPPVYPPPQSMAKSAGPLAAFGGAVRRRGKESDEEDTLLSDVLAEPAQIATTTIETNSSGSSVTYHVPKSTNIPNDGSPHKTTIAIIPLEASLDYVTAPKLASEVYLRAKIKNTSPYLFLPGKANIFHDADFVGNTELELTAPNEEFELQLGVDSRIKAERKLTQRTVSKTFLGGSKRITFTYINTITNNTTKPVKITIFDQLPVASHEQIKVKNSEISPKPTEQDDLQIIKWELDLKAGEKKEFSLTFTVEHPKEYTIIGLS